MGATTMVVRWTRRRRSLLPWRRASRSPSPTAGTRPPRKRRTPSTATSGRSSGARRSPWAPNEPYVSASMRSEEQERSGELSYQGTFGIHFPIHQPLWVDHGAVDLLRLADYAVETGFRAIWINDNFKARHTSSLLAAIAARLPVDLGTLVTYPFARNPVDLATAVGTIAELLADHEVRIGISTGAWAIQGRLVDRPRPTQSVRETIAIIRHLLAGDEVRFHDYPAVSSYYHFQADAKLRLQFQAPQPPSFWIPPKGPRMLQLAAEVGDGVVFNTYTQYAALPAVRDGSLARTLQTMEQQRLAAGNPTP